MPRSARHRPADWIGAIVEMPSTITGEGAPYHPEILVWMDREGGVIGTELGRPGEVLPVACESLRQTMAKPLVGQPREPGSIRVGSAELAAALQAGFPQLEVFVGPTPEADALLAAMREELGNQFNGLLDALDRGVPEAAVAAVFDAAAELFDAAPWSALPSDQDVIGVTIEALDLRDGVVSVIGQLGQQLGWVLFPDARAFDVQMAAADALERGAEPDLPDQLGLTFDPVEEVVTDLRERADREGWPVADEDAWPNLLALDESSGQVRPVTAREVAIAEAISRALSRLAGDPGEMVAALRGREERTWTYSVTTHTGVVDLTLRAPVMERLLPLRPPAEILAEMRALEDFEDEASRHAYGTLVQQLMQSFLASPEAETLPDVDLCAFVLDFTLDMTGESLATLEPGALDEVVFDLLPAKASIGPDAGPEIVAQLRALYGYLAREGALPQASDCSSVLADDAADRLRAALDEPSNFGPAKRMVMEAQAAGVDLSSPAAVEAWMLRQQGLAPGREAGSPAPNRRTKHARADAKKRDKRKRKAAGKARKRGR